MPIHPLWLVFGLVIPAFVIGVIVMLGAFLARSAGYRDRLGPSDPQISGDGKWWWDGRQWRPMPQPTPAGPASGTPPQ
jgi:hypothetical protein